MGILGFGDSDICRFWDLGILGFGNSGIWGLCDLGILRLRNSESLGFGGDSFMGDIRNSYLRIL